LAWARLAAFGIPACSFPWRGCGCGHRRRVSPCRSARSGRRRPVPAPCPRSGAAVRSCTALAAAPEPRRRPRPGWRSLAGSCRGGGACRSRTAGPRGPVDRDQRAVDHDMGVPGPLGIPQCRAQLRATTRPAGPPSRSHASRRWRCRSRTRCQLGERLALTQVGQHQQRLLGGGELAPGRPDLPAVAAMIPAT
jgi:hypothetical protein